MPFNMPWIAPEAGAYLNTGIALMAQQKNSEAEVSFRQAMHSGSFEHALNAAKRMRQMGIKFKEGEVEIILCEALRQSGRTREAAINYEAAYRNYPDNPSVREQIMQRMDTLAEEWDTAPDATKLIPQEFSPKKNKRSKATKSDQNTGASPEVNVVDATASGATQTTSLGKLTPELIAQLKQGATPELFEKILVFALQPLQQFLPLRQRYF